MVRHLLRTGVVVAVGIILVGCGGDSGTNSSNGNNGNNGGENDDSLTVQLPDTLIGDDLTYRGQTYRTVVIDGTRWMAENLNWELPSTWCYDDVSSNCAVYGRLYTWSVARQLCPSGWRLPDNTDWDNLTSYVGGIAVQEDEAGGVLWEGAGTKLKSPARWRRVLNPNAQDENDFAVPRGTDDFEFSALPGGWRAGAAFLSITDLGYWWSATSVNVGNAWVRSMHFDNEDVGTGVRNTQWGFSVRCVRDEL